MANVPGGGGGGGGVCSARTAMETASRARIADAVQYGTRGLIVINPACSRNLSLIHISEPTRPY